MMSSAKQRDVRRLEHVAAGIEDEIGRSALRRAGVCAPWPSRSSKRVIELQTRNMLHVVRHFAEAFDAVLALRHGVGFGVHHGDARHVQQEPRIDAVIAGLDAVAGEEAARRPFARGFVALAAPEDVDDAVDDVDGVLQLFRRESGRDGARTDCHAFAATGAGVRHGVGAGLQGGFEGLCHRA